MTLTSALNVAFGNSFHHFKTKFINGSRCRSVYSTYFKGNLGKKNTRFFSDQSGYLPLAIYSHLINQNARSTNCFLFTHLIPWLADESVTFRLVTNDTALI